MNEKYVGWVVVAAIVVVLVASAYVYNYSSTATVEALHDRYDIVLPAHVTISPATPSGTLGTATVSDVWSLDMKSIDFGVVKTNSTSALFTITLTNVGLPDVLRTHLSTNLNAAGVHLWAADSSFFNSQKVDLTALEPKGVTIQIQIPASTSAGRTFAVSVDPGAAPADIYFTITISYSYCND